MTHKNYRHNQRPTSRDVPEALTIRLAVPADGPALDRLAQLDSAPRPKPGPMLLAQVDGDLRAAVPLDGGPPIATPFHPTADIVRLLAERARQLDSRPRPRARRRLRPLTTRSLFAADPVNPAAAPGR